MTEVAIVAPKPTALAQFTPADVEVIKQQICKGSTDAELKLFLAVCRKTGLDPIAKQIYAVKRWDSKEQREVMAIQTGIDGYRLIAERSGKYQGQKGPFWSDGKLYPMYDQNGNQVGENLRWLEAWPYPEPPMLARVGVLRAGFAEPVWAVARYASYVQTVQSGQPNKFWKQMPDVMLSKCAESLAIRKAFPMETAGIYTQEEMGQADHDEDDRPAAITAARQSQNRSQPKNELFAEATAAIGIAADMAALHNVWTHIYKDQSRFSPAEFADLEKLKDQRKESLSRQITAPPARTPSPVETIERIHDMLRDIEDMTSSDDVEGYLGQRGADRLHLDRLDPDALRSLDKDLQGWLESERTAAV